MGCSALIWVQTLLTLQHSSSTSGWSLFDESCGHWFSGKRRNSGPCCHLSVKLRTGIPRETLSATFSSPGICFHWEGSVLVWISPTLTDTKGLNFLASLRIHARTISLSKNRMTFSNWKRDSRTMVLHSLEAKTAPWSYRRGMVNLFSGATLDFATIKRTSYSPFDVCHRAYAREPNALLEDNKRWCKADTALKA